MADPKRTAWNSTLPAREKPMSPGKPLARSRLLRPVQASGVPVVVALRAPRAPSSSPAAFTPKVRKLVRERAGNACEACAVYLGPAGGQLQHRVARGMGGSRNPVLGSPANAVLLCGTPATGCHGRCEVRNTEMHANGFWLWQYESPLVVPIMLHGRVTRWLAQDGSYSDMPPQEAA